MRALKTAAIVLLLAFGTAWAQEGFTTLLEDTGETGVGEKTILFSDDFNQAMKLLEQGKYEDARVALEKIIARNPDSAVARRLRDSAKQQVIFNAFIDAPQPTLETLKRFLSLAEQGRREWLRDEERISKLVNDVVEGEFDEMWLAIHELNLAGQHAVPELVDLLRQEDQEARTKVAMALISVGSPGVLPLCEALQTTDELTKQEIIFILGEIGDKKALPALAEISLAADKPSIRESAARTIEKIGGSAAKSPQEYYLDLANAYFTKDVSIIQSSADDFLIWNWDADSRKLVSRRTPEYSYYLETAEICCYKALAVDIAYQKAYPLLLNIYVQQLNTNRTLLEAVAAGLGEVSEAELEAITARKERAEDILRSARSFGKVNYYDALARALADSNTDSTVSIIGALAELGSSQDLPVPVETRHRHRDDLPIQADADSLVAALNSDAKLVRYHAAVALAGLADRSFPGIEKIVPLLSQALGERGANVIMVADSNIQVLNQLRSRLTESGYLVDTAADPASAVNIGFSVPMKDVMVIDAELTQAIDTFIGDFRTQQIPIILLTTEDNAERTKIHYEDKVTAILSKPASEAELEALLKASIAEADRSSAKSTALNLNYLAANALANVNVYNTALPMGEAVPALVGALELPDAVRLEALKALANIADPVAQNPLASAAADTANSLECRLSALEALKAIAVRRGGIYSNVTETAQKLLVDSEPDIRTAAATLIGASNRLGISAAAEALIADGKWVGGEN